MGWYRELVAAKFDGSKKRRSPGRPKIDAEVERLVVKIAKENDWGSRCIVGALANLGFEVAHQTVLNILKRHNLPTAPEPKKTIPGRIS
jgi:putative transposase